MPTPYSVKLLNRFAGIQNLQTTGRKEGRKIVNRPPFPRSTLGGLLRFLFFVRHFGAIGCAAALTLAGVLALATVVTRLTTALALTRVLALTSVLFLDFLVGFLVLRLVLCVKCGLQPRE